MADHAANCGNHGSAEHAASAETVFSCRSKDLRDNNRLVQNETENRKDLGADSDQSRVRFFALLHWGDAAALPAVWQGRKHGSVSVNLSRFRRKQ